MTLDGGESFANTAVAGSPVQPTARISVANVATVQVMNKSNITIDPAGGPDRVLLGALRNPAGLPTFRGLIDATTSCAIDGVAGAPLCVVAGPELGDAVELLPVAGAEGVILTTRLTQPSDTSRLWGLPASRWWT